MIDLRSDTVTRPDEEMRRAMASAEVGDDVFGEDPTVRLLEEESAAALGAEASLFVPSGTMGNEIALHLHGRPGSEVICEASSHIVLYELGAMAAISGLLPRLVEGEGGLISPDQVERAIAPDLIYRARTGVLSLENTANMAGGAVYPVARSDALLEVARRHGLPVHLDGARIFNAAEALGVAPQRLGRGFDSVMFSLSKGLGAPVGSMLCGSAAFIAEARRVRKMLGGGMRQVGILAAAGLIALRRGPQRLARDHANARRLAEALVSVPGVKLDPWTVQTNIVVLGLEDPPSGAPAGAEGPAAVFVEACRRAGVLGVAVGPRTVRFVTHRDVDEGDVGRAIDAISRLRRSAGP